MIKLDELKESYSSKQVKLSKPFEILDNKMVTYQVIPHADVTNNNRRMWRSIYKMFEMYNSPMSRIERNGFKITLRKKDLFWFDIVFRQKENNKYIEFYVSTSEYQARKLKRKLEDKMNVTFKEATTENLQVPDSKKAVVQELRYTKHNVFSLGTNFNDVKTPIASVLNTIDEIQFDGDFARLSICNDIEKRKRWVNYAQWAYEKIDKGKIPQRSMLSPRNIGIMLRTLTSTVVGATSNLMTDIFNALEKVFIGRDKEYEKQEAIIKKYSLEDEIGTARLSKEKGNMPVFRSHIRAVAYSEDALTRDSIAETLALSMQDLSDANEMHGVKLYGRGRKKAIKELNTLKLSSSTLRNTNVNLVSTDEMSKMAFMLPNRELQLKYMDELQVKTRVEVTIPAAMRNQEGIYLGMASLKDEKIDIYMPLTNYDNFYRAYTFIGGQGAGKDNSIKKWVIEGNLKHGISFVVIDAILEEGERGMADGIRDSLPPENIIDLNLNDDDYIPPMDLTEVIAALGRNGPSRFADEMIDFIQLDGLNRSEKYLTDAAKASGGSLFNIKRIIEDEDFRADTIVDLRKKGNIRLSDELLSWGDNKEIGNKCDAILHRLNRFFGNERLYDIFAQKPLPELDFRKWMTEGKVIILRVPNGKGLGKHAVKTLVHWITLKAFMTRLLMSKEEQENGCFIVFNEPEQYESDGLSELMGRIATEGRKERLGSLYAFHHWDKLSTSLQKNLRGGGVQQFLFMNDDTKTFELSKHRFEDTIPLEEAYKLPAHHAIISVRAENELQPAFICHMAALAKPSYDNSFLTKRHCRMYGRPWEELQKAL